MKQEKRLSPDGGEYLGWVDWSMAAQGLLGLRSWSWLSSLARYTIYNIPHTAYDIPSSNSFTPADGVVQPPERSRSTI